jgi:hypothetical protein
MRKVFVFALLLVLLASCSTGRLPWNRGISMDDAKESVYQVQVELTIDVSPYYAMLQKKEEERRKKEEEERKKMEEQNPPPQRAGFGFPRFVFTEPHIPATEKNIFLGAEMTKVNDSTAKIGWAGTGWVAARANGRTFLMTAGHVCESKNTFTLEYWDIDWDTLRIAVRTMELPIIEKNHRLVSREGVEYQMATIIRDEDLDEETFNGPDLCMLGAIGDLGRPLPLADEDPDYASRSEVIGAPRTLWGGGIAVASDVKFSGRGSVFGVDPDGLTFNGEVAPGNSGSGVLHDGRVVGVISLGAVRFPSLVHAVPHEIVREFIRKALHKKD